MGIVNIMRVSHTPIQYGKLYIAAAFVNNEVLYSSVQLSVMAN